MDFVVGDRDGLSHPIADRSCLPFQSPPEHRQRDVGGLSTRGLTTNPVDDNEQAARDVDVEPILVDIPLQSGIGVACRSQRAHRPD